MGSPTTFFIVIPVHDGAAFLPAALDSVAHQDLAGCRVHLHVQDGASTDGTPDLVREWSSRMDAGRQHGELVVSWASNPDGGMYDAIMKAVAAESRRFFEPDVFFWLNADDILMPGALRNLAATFRGQTVCWVIGAAVDIDVKGGILLQEPHRRIPEADLMNGDFNYTGHHWLRAESTAMRMTAARECGFFTTGLRLAGDYELFTKLARRWPPTYVDYAVRGFRRHAGQLSKAMVEYQHERSRARHFLAVAAAAPDRRPHAPRLPPRSREILFYPDRSASDPYQPLLYAAARAWPAESLEVLGAACRQATAPLIVHVHWLDEIVGRARGAAEAEARDFADVITAARRSGHRIVFTLHGLSDPTAPSADIEAQLVEFLFANSDLVHMHHPAVAAEVRGRLRTFPWRRVVFVEHGPYPQTSGPGESAARPAGFVLFNEPDATNLGPLFHALATGSPVIAPRCGRVPSYVFEGYNGFLFEPHDDVSRSAALAKATAACENGGDPDLRRHATQTVAHLDWRTMLDTILRRLP